MVLTLNCEVDRSLYFHEAACCDEHPPSPLQRGIDLTTPRQINYVESSICFTSTPLRTGSCTSFVMTFIKYPFSNLNIPIL